MPKKRNEATSKRVASIAGKVLKQVDGAKSKYVWTMPRNANDWRDPEQLPRMVCTVEELKALAASALTQREPGNSVRKRPDEVIGYPSTNMPFLTNRKPPKRKPARKGRK